MKSLSNVLPCRFCRENYAENLKTLPLTGDVLQTRATFSRWVYDMHELVNGRLGKQSNLTYEKVRDFYENFRSRCVRPTGKSQIENGCTVPLYGMKSKCVLNIVPNSQQHTSLQVDTRCVLKKKL